MTTTDATRSTLFRDQLRALHAYDAISMVPKAQQNDYKIVINDFGVSVLRNGLCAAIAAVQRLNRENDRRGDVLLGHLAAANVPGLEGVPAQKLAEKIRKLDAVSYMIATREVLQVATWLKRAAQASFDEG